MPIPIKIDKLTATDTYIEYKEKNSLTDSSGKIKFAKSSIIISGIDNRLTTKGAVTKAKFSSHILGSVPMSADVVFYLDNMAEGNFFAEAGVKQKTDLKVLNQVLPPMALMKINDGLVDYVNVRLTGSNKLAQGTLTGSYSKLKVSLLKKANKSYNKNDLKSLLGNLVVKNGNVNRSKSYPINYSAKNNKSFFNFIWMATLSGIKTVALLKL